MRKLISFAGQGLLVVVCVPWQPAFLLILSSGASLLSISEESMHLYTHSSFIHTPLLYTHTPPFWSTLWDCGVFAGPGACVLPSFFGKQLPTAHCAPFGDKVTKYNINVSLRGARSLFTRNLPSRGGSAKVAVNMSMWLLMMTMVMHLSGQVQIFGQKFCGKFGF